MKRNLVFKGLIHRNQKMRSSLAENRGMPPPLHLAAKPENVSAQTKIRQT